MRSPREDADEVVLGRQEEAGGARVALTARAAAELVVDAAALVALGADDVEAAEIGHALAQLDVHAAAGHVRRDGHGARLAGVLDDLGLAGVVLRVQHVVLDPAPGEHPREHLGDLDRDRPDQHRLAALVRLDDLLHDGAELRVLRLEDVVVLVGPDHRLVGRDRGDLGVVDLRELVCLGRRRARHARELLVHAEVVLQRDRREGLVLLPDPEPLLGLQGLVEALGVAPPLEHPARELVHDQQLAVADDVLLVLAVEGVRLQRLDQVVDEVAVDVEVEVLDAERLLDLVDAALGGRGGAVLLVDVVVLVLLEGRDDPREAVVGVGRRLRHARDDQRRAGLVDQDRVDLVHDAEVVAALHAVRQADGHVVAQVVEAELGVGAVGHVGRVGLRGAGPPASWWRSRRRRCRAGRRSDPSTRRPGGRGSR